MKFKAPGDKPISVALLSGDTICIPPEGREVPPRFRKAALAAGCIVVGVDVEPPKENREPTKGEIIRAAIEKMLDSDEEGAFGADGKPSVKVLSRECGFNVSAAERDEAWAAVQATLTDEKGGE